MISFSSTLHFLPLCTIYCLFYFLHPALFPDERKIAIPDSITHDLTGPTATTDLSRASSSNVTFLRRYIYQSCSRPLGGISNLNWVTWASLLSILMQFIVASMILAKASREKYAPELIPDTSVFILLFSNTRETLKLHYIFSVSS